MYKATVGQIALTAELIYSFFAVTVIVKKITF